MTDTAGHSQNLLLWLWGSGYHPDVDFLPPLSHLLGALYIICRKTVSVRGWASITLFTNSCKKINK